MSNPDSCFGDFENSNQEAKLEESKRKKEKKGFRDRITQDEDQKGVDDVSEDESSSDESKRRNIKTYKGDDDNKASEGRLEAGSVIERTKESDPADTVSKRSLRDVESVESALKDQVKNTELRCSNTEENVSKINNYKEKEENKETLKTKECVNIKESEEQKIGNEKAINETAKDEGGMKISAKGNINNLSQKQTEESESKDKTGGNDGGGGGGGKKPCNKLPGIPPGVVRNLGNTGLKGSSLPLLLSMPAGGGGLSLLSAGLPPGRYVILPSTTTSIPSISNIASSVSPVSVGGKSSLVAQITHSAKTASVFSCSTATTTTTATSNSPSVLNPPLSTGPTAHPVGRGSYNGGRSYRGRRKSYTAAEKLAMIEAVESGQKKSNVADQFGVAPSTLACILLQKNKIRCDQMKIDMSRRRLRQTRQMPIVPAPPSSKSSNRDSDGSNDSPFVHFMSPLSPLRPPIFEETPEEIISVPDLSDRMGMDGPQTPTKLEGSSSFLTCSPLISAMPGIHEDLLSGAGPSSSSMDHSENEGMHGDYDQDDMIDVKAEPVFNVESEICDDENSQNNTQSSCDRHSSQSSPTPGMAGPYLLKKETHCTTILDQLLRDDTFSDVTLTAEGQSMRAHKIVLCLASAYFRQVLSKESNVQNVIVFRDIKFMELKNIINFIYTGEATVDAAELESFMKTAEMLEVTSLCDGQRNIPKNLIPKNKDGDNDKNKTTFAAKRSHNTSSSVASPPAKTRKISDNSSTPQTHKSVSYPSTSSESPTLPISHINLPPPPQPLVSVIKSEPPADDAEGDEEFEAKGEMDGSFESITRSPSHPQEPDNSPPPEKTSISSPSLDKVPIGKCPFCPNSQQLRKGNALTKHMYLCHPDKTVFCCDNCSRVFLKKGAYEAHIDDCNR